MEYAHVYYKYPSTHSRDLLIIMIRVPALPMFNNTGIRTNCEGRLSFSAVDELSRFCYRFAIVLLVLLCIPQSPRTGTVYTHPYRYCRKKAVLPLRPPCNPNRTQSLT